MEEEKTVSIEVGDTTGNVTAVGGNQINDSDDAHVGQGDTGNVITRMFGWFIGLFQ